MPFSSSRWSACRQTPRINSPRSCPAACASAQGWRERSPSTQRSCFLDEPTAGLDPIGASDFDHLIRKLQQTLGLTVYMVTHDLDTIFTVCDRVAVLADKKIVRTGSPTELQRQPNHPWIKEYFCGERARAASPGEQAEDTDFRLAVSPSRFEEPVGWKPKPTI